MLNRHSEGAKWTGCLLYIYVKKFMKHLTILVPVGEGNNISSIVGSYKIFSRANAYRKQTGKRDLFSIHVAGTSRRVRYYDGLFSVNPDTQITAIERTDLIIIPSLNHNYQTSLKKNVPLIKWIESQYNEGAEVASICTGAFLLAETGLLNGRTCSTNWAVADSFRKMFPEVILQTDKLITDERGIYTSGGAYSFLNLVIYLVEKYYGRETAIYCSKVFQVEMERKSQSPFIIFKGQKSHGDTVVEQAQAFIEKQWNEKISMERLSARYSVSRRNFDRRFIKATGNSPGEYHQRIRIEAAKKYFETTGKNVNEVMFDVGYSDAKAFREVFRKITGLSPLEYRNRYNIDSI